MLVRLTIPFIAVIAIACVALGVREATYGVGPRVSSSPPDGPTTEVAIVANAVAGTVSVIDVGAFDVVATLDVTPDGDRVSFFRDPVQSVAQPIAEGRGGLNYAQDTDLSRDGRVLFVSRGFLADVIAIDLQSGEILWRTPIAGVRADHMTISPDGERLFVSAVIRGGDVVEILDTRSGARLGAARAGPWPHDVHVSQDGARLYVASLGDMERDLAECGEDDDAYTVVIADAVDGERRRAIRFDAGVRPFQINADESKIFAQLSNAHVIVTRDVASGEKLASLNLPVADGVTVDDWDFEAPHHGLALTGDDQTLCVAGRASDYAAIVEATPLTLRGTIDVGDAPSWAALSADDAFCFLANTRSDDVSIIAVAELKEVARLPVGRGPKHITMGHAPQALISALRNGD